MPTSPKRFKPGPPIPSAEQREILSAVRQGYNVQVVARAGTGKTTTASLIAEHCPHLRILVLTYNRNLTDDSNRVFEDYGLNNIQCKTYHEQIGCIATHSAEKRIVCKTDRHVLRVLRKWRVCPPEPIREYDLIVLDETQDMTDSLRKAMHHMIARDESAPQLVIMGDPKQLLRDYDRFDPALSTFLEEAPIEFEEHSGGREWCKRTLTISYRCTANMTTLINLMWGTDIVAGNDRSPNVPIEYWVCDPYGQKLTQRLASLLQSEPHGDVVFLNVANLVNKETGAERPIKKQINKLLSMKDSDGKRMFNFHTQQTERDARCSTTNKVRAWTFASSKGCTFPVVVVFGFSVYKGNIPHLNQLCVALSRACRRLIVIHNESSRGTPQPYVPPLTSKVLRDLVEDGVVVCPDGIPHDESIPAPRPPDVRVSLPVTSLTHMSAMSIEHLLDMGTRTMIAEATVPLEYKQLCPFHTGVRESEEDVSAIYGTAIMFAVEDARTRSIKNVEGLLTPLTLESDEQYTTESFCAIVWRALNMALTKAERDALDRAMGASPSEELSGEKLAFVIRLSIADFPSLCRHGVRARRGRDEVFTTTYTKSVCDVYEKETKTATDYMYLANASLAFEGTHEVFVQIGHDDYDQWVDVDVFWTAVERIEHTLAKLVPSSGGEAVQMVFELPLSVQFEEAIQGTRHIVLGMTGRVDVAYGDTSVEVKFCNSLSDEHELQNLLYAAMNCITHGGVTGVSTLYNSRTNECVVHRVTRENAVRVLKEAASMRA